MKSFPLHAAAAACLRHLPAEAAHNAALWGIRHGLGPRLPPAGDPRLTTTAFGLDFPNPLGLAAGFDKSARAAAQLFGFGFGFVEVGGVTPLPQAGNPRPRLFRLPADQAVINRMGFNNPGAAVVHDRFLRLNAPGIIGVNLAANGDSPEPVADFERLVATFAPVAAFLTLDISCPNTANGRVFLSPAPLADLLARTRAKAPNRTPLLIKLSPDLTDIELHDILDVALDAVRAAAVDGIIVSNTTTARPPGLRSPRAAQKGGLSGAPLFEPSTALLRQVYAYTGGQIPLIGVGGIATPEHAYAKIRAGASLLQLYTALVYSGPGVVSRTLDGLSALLSRDGFSNVADAVGAQ